MKKNYTSNTSATALSSFNKEKSSAKINIKRINLFLLLLLISTASMFGTINIIKFPTTDFCSTYPSAFVTGNFSIYETVITGNNGFTKGQTNKTMILDFTNANFQFNPGVGTVAVTGSEVIISSVVITATNITLTISTAATNVTLDTISFTGFQVQALATGNGYIRRDGGTFKVNNSLTRPLITRSWGNFVAGIPETIASDSATQNVTSPVYSGTSNNQIMGIQVVVAGTCSPPIATSFSFTTNGSTNPGVDITTAKLYYTGTVNTFAPTNLFGTAVNPNGAFTITGSRTMGAGAGTYYFWLAYDIAALGIAGNNDTVDATYQSAIIAGNTYTPTVTAPFGNRPISNNIYYSIDTGYTGLWSTTAWSRTMNGPTCGCAPIHGNGFVFVNNPIALDNSYTVDDVTVQTGGALTDNTGTILTITNNLTTTNNGTFAATNSWVVDNVATSGTGTSSSSAPIVIMGTLGIGDSTTLQMTGGAQLTINGDIAINGTLDLGSSNATCSNLAGSIISGTGNVLGTGTITLGVNKTIPAGSILTIAPVVAINDSVMVTNNGTIYMQNDITGGGPNADWVNGASALLDMGGTSSTLLATGILDATAVPNTVSYSGSGNQNINTPLNSSYYNLYTSSAAAGVKTLQAPITINGDLQINTGAQFNAGGNNDSINIYGNWINNSTNATPFYSDSSTVYFDGSAETISGIGVTNFYNLEITSTGFLTANSNTGTIFISGNWIANGDFTHNGSDITFNGTSTISGTSVTDFYTAIVTPSSTLSLDAIETDFEGNLTGNGTILPNSGLVVFQGAGNTQNINGTGAPLTLHQVTITNNGGSVLLGRTLTINNTLTLANGTFTVGGNLSMSNNTVISRSVGILSAAPNFAAHINVIYTGTSVITTGPEIPTAATVLSNLTLNNTGGITLSANATVNATLTFTTGLITTGANKVTIANAGTVTGAAAGSYVYGNLEKGIAAATSSINFEIGDAAIYTPVNVTFSGTATNATGTITAYVTPGDHSNMATSGIDSTLSVNRFWTLTNNNVTFGTYSATFNYAATDIDAGANTANFIIRRYNSGLWSATTTGALNPLNSQFTTGADTTFGDFEIGDPTITLSVNQLTMNNGQLTIYPNPCTSQTTITFSEIQKNTIIRVIDVLGKEVNSVILSGTNTDVINLGNISKGIYFVQVTDENGNSVNRKIVVQ